METNKLKYEKNVEAVRKLLKPRDVLIAFDTPTTCAVNVVWVTVRFLHNLAIKDLEAAGFRIYGVYHTDFAVQILLEKVR